MRRDRARGGAHRSQNVLAFRRGKMGSQSPDFAFHNTNRRVDDLLRVHRVGELNFEVFSRPARFYLSCTYGFGLAGLGMLAGLATFVRGRALFNGAGEPQDPARLHERVGGVTRETLIYIAGAVAVVGAWVLMQYREFVGGLLGFTSAAAVAGIVWYALARCSKVERDRMFVVLYLTVVSVVFWTFFEQAGTSMTLFTERNVDKVVSGVAMHASQMGFMNPLFIILLAPVFSVAWAYLSGRGWEPSTPMKFGLGVVQVGLGFAALVIGARYADGGGQVALIWLALAYLLHTTGELCLSPVGLSMVTRLSVTKVVGLMMGVWFLSSAAAHYVAGVIAAFAAVDKAPGTTVDPLASLPVYVSTFEALAWVGVGVGLLVMVSAPFVRKFMHEH